MTTKIRPQTTDREVKEDRSHRDHALNPRIHPEGPEEYESPSKSKIWRNLNKIALLSGPEMRFLQDVPRFLGTGDYANLGHAQGASAILLADGLREYSYAGTVYSVDLFPRQNDEKKAITRIKEFGLEDRIVTCKGSTKKWAENLHDKRFKFVFVDADHSFQGVKDDFYSWSFLLEKGGWISFHDTNQDFSHKALQDTVVGRWHELKAFHVHRIRTFQKPK